MSKLKRYFEFKDNKGCVAPLLIAALFRRLQALVNMKVSTYRTDFMVFIHLHFGQRNTQNI